MKLLIDEPNIQAVYAALKNNGVRINDTRTVVDLLTDVVNMDSKTTLNGWLYRELDVKKLVLTSKDYHAAEKAYNTANLKRVRNGQKEVSATFYDFLNELEGIFKEQT